MTRFYAAWLFTLLFACSQGANRLSPAGTSDPVAATRGTRGLVSPARQFVSYVPAASRLSVFDQASESEAYGFDFAATVHAAFPVASFDGVAALTNSGLTVFSAGLRRQFSFEYSAADWDYASAAPAFAFAASQGVRVIRHLGGDTWQDELLPGLTPPALDAPIMSASGTLLVMLRAESGAYAVYRAESASAAIGLRQTCARASLLPPPIVAVAMLGSKVLWGNTAGQLGVVDSDANGCQPIAATSTLPGGIEIARIIPRSDHSILVFAVGGSVYDWDGGQSVTALAKLLNCDFPLAPVVLADDDIATICLNDLDAATDARTILYQSARYSFFKKARSAAQYSRELTLSTVAAMGIDALSKRLFVLSNSALGRLTVVDLATGNSHEARGFFVKNILER